MLLLDGRVFDPRSVMGLIGWYDFSDATKMVTNPVGAAAGSGVSVLKNKVSLTSLAGNVLLASEDFSTASWVRTRLNAFGATDTGAAGAGSFANTTRTTDPLGTNTADFIQEDSSAANTFFIAQTINLPLSSFKFSCWIKPAGRTWIRLVLTFGANLLSCYFDTQNGTVGVAASAGGGSGASGVITSAGNGWYLCTLSGSFSAALVGVVCRVQIAEADNDTTYSGDNTSGLYLWGASVVDIGAGWSQVIGPSLSQGYYATTTLSHDPIHALLQTTAANQPILSRSDNKGNMLLQSETFQTTWARTTMNAFGATDTGGVGAGSFADTTRTTDPLGGNTADFVQEDGTVTTSHLLSQAVIGPAGTYIFRVYVKAAGRTWVRFRIVASSDSISGYFDVQNKVVGTVANSGSASGGVGSFGTTVSGWQECILTGTVTVPISSVQILIASADNTSSYSGDNTSGLYLWGASLRESTWDSDYISTTSVIAYPGKNGLKVGYLNGTTHYLKTSQINLVQPETVMLIGKQITWTSGEALFDGFANDSLLIQQTTSSPQIRIFAASGVGNISPALNVVSAITGIFNGASSQISNNLAAAVTGNAGASNGAGLTLGAKGGASVFANIVVLEILVFNRALNAGEIAYLVTGLGKKWGFVV